MKLFSDCSGECCVCGCGTGCIAGHGDDFYYEATIEQVVERLNTGRYHAYRQYMIDWLRNKGYEEGKNERPQGEWLWLGDNPNSNHKWSCSKCGRGVKEQENFCPNCGLKMQKEGDKE